MSDSYLMMATIANNSAMNERLRAALTQQVRLGSASLPDGQEPLEWVSENKYVWAGSPGWGAAWASAVETHKNDEKMFDPGQAEDVITDGQILAAVQSLAAPPEEP